MVQHDRADSLRQLSLELLLSSDDRSAMLREIATLLLRLRLAGGIARDLNNVLSPILMSLEVLQMKYTDEESKVWLQILQASAERGAAMVKQVLSFARGSEGKRVVFQPKHAISDLVGILKETFPKSIRIEFDPPRDPKTINADPTQVKSN